MKLINRKNPKTKLNSLINGNEVTFSTITGKVVHIQELQNTELWIRTSNSEEVFVKIDRLLTPIKLSQQISLLFAHNETKVMMKPVSVFIHTSKTYYTFVNDKLCKDLKLYDPWSIVLPFLSLTCIMLASWVLFPDYISIVGWLLFFSAAIVSYTFLFFSIYFLYHFIVKKRVKQRLIKISKQIFRELKIQKPIRILKTA